MKRLDGTLSAPSRLEELRDAVALGRYVLAPEVDQLAAEGRVEQEVARQLRHRRIRPEAAQQVAHHPGHAVSELLGELADEVRGPDPQHVDLAELIARMTGRAVQHARVDALAVLHVDLDGVEHPASRSTPAISATVGGSSGPADVVSGGGPPAPTPTDRAGPGVRC